MIARLNKDDGTEMLLLGLTRENVKRLVDRQPIHVRRATHGEGVPANWEIVLMFGETELAMQAELKAAGAIRPETKVHVDPRPIHIGSWWA